MQAITLVDSDISGDLRRVTDRESISLPSDGLKVSFALKLTFLNSSTLEHLLFFFQNIRVLAFTLEILRAIRLWTIDVFRFLYNIVRRICKTLLTFLKFLVLSTLPVLKLRVELMKIS